MLHIYGLTRPEAEHVLDSFPVLRKYEEASPEKGGYGEFRTKRIVLDLYDQLAEAARTGTPWRSPWTHPRAPVPATRRGEFHEPAAGSPVSRLRSIASGSRRLRSRHDGSSSMWQTPVAVPNEERSPAMSESSERTRAFVQRRNQRLREALGVPRSSYQRVRVSTRSPRRRPPGCAADSRRS